MNQNSLANRFGGFTFMELVITVAVLGIMAASGVVIFSRSLRDSSRVETRRTLDDRARVMLDGLARFLREGQVVVTGASFVRSNCLVAGSVNGDNLLIKALDGLDTSISVSLDGFLSSNSAVWNPESVTIRHKSGLGYYFTWYCQQGVPDRLVMEFNAVATGAEGETSINNDYILDLVMRNSGQ